MISLRRPQDVDAWNDCLKDGEHTFGKAELEDAAFHSAYETLVSWLCNNQDSREINQLQRLAFGCIECIELLERIYRRIASSSRVRALILNSYLYLVLKVSYPTSGIFRVQYTAYYSKGKRKDRPWAFKLITNAISLCGRPCAILLSMMKSLPAPKLGPVCIYVEILLENFLTDVFKALNGACLRKGELD